MYDSKPNLQSPNLVIVGNIAYDIINFSKVNDKRNDLINIGGACVFSTIPASIFYRVGMVGKIGKDLDISKFFNYNIDLSGVKQINMPTTKFYTVLSSIDGQERIVNGEVNPEMEVGYRDIPKHFLNAKHFHLTTAVPNKQLEIINFLRENTKATISVDTIDEFANIPTCKEVFNSVDYAFIDREFSSLLSCKAPKKIIKYGKTGCLYYSKEKTFSVYSHIIKNVVDKTGAGDCLNGVFMNLIINGICEEKALRIAVDVATDSIKYEGIMNINLYNKMLEREER